MARRSSQKHHHTATGPRAGCGRTSIDTGVRRRHEREDLKIEFDIESMSVNPREIELLCHFFSAEIDALLRGDG